LKSKEALDYIAEQGKDSRTIMFNATMGALTVFSLSVVPMIEPIYPTIAKLIQPTLLFVSSIGGVVLYGLTLKKGADGGYNHLFNKDAD